MNIKKYLPMVKAILILILVVFSVTFILVSIQGLFNSEEWIGFFGSFSGGILGGVITQIGIIYMLDYFNNRYENEKKTTEEKERRLMMPYIEFKEGHEHQHTCYKFRLVDKYHYKNLNTSLEDVIEYTFNLNVCNIGLGTAVNIRLMKNDSYIIEEGAIFNLQKSETCNIQISLLTDKELLQDVYEISFLFDDLLGNVYKEIILITADQHLNSKEYAFKISYNVHHELFSANKEIRS